MPRSLGAERPEQSGPAQRWAKRYGDLQRFIELTGGMPRERANASGQEDEESLLAGWARYQRRRERNGTLLDWQRTLLEQVDAFSWDPLVEQWEERCEELRVFLTGKGRMPRYRSTDDAERSLAAWVHKQRHVYTHGRLPQSRVDALRSLPFRIV